PRPPPPPTLFPYTTLFRSNHQRSQRRSMALRLKLTDEQPLATPDPASAIAGRADLVRAWNRLTTNEREVIALTAWDELSQDEAATVLGCTKTTTVAASSWLSSSQAVSAITSRSLVIALTAWDELSQDEAATVLGCTKTTYAVRLHRARRRMLHLLNRTTPGGDH